MLVFVFCWSLFFTPLLVGWSPVVFNEKSQSALAAVNTSPRHRIREGRLWQQHAAISLIVRAKKDQISIYRPWKCNLLILGAWKRLVDFLLEDNDRHFVTITWLRKTKNRSTHVRHLTQESSHYCTQIVHILKDLLCYNFKLCEIAMNWCHLFRDYKSGIICWHFAMPNHVRSRLAIVKNNRVLWMLMP